MDEILNFYNEELKNQFISKYDNQNTRNIFTYTLRTIAELEKKFNKDLYEFTFEEVYMVLKKFEATSVVGLETRISIIRAYLQFCQDCGYIKEIVINRINENDYKDLLYHNDFQNLYILSRKYLNYIIDFCDNAQDGVIFALLFDGINGKKHEELVNLKVSDVDFSNNIINIRNIDNSDIKRVVNIHPDTITRIKDAITQVTYRHELIETTRKRELMLAKNEYIIRLTLIKRTPENEPITARTIISRVKKIGQLIGKPGLTPQNIFCSGMLVKLKEIDENKFLFVDDFKRVAEMYGLKPENYSNIMNLYKMVTKGRFL